MLGTFSAQGTPEKKSIAYAGNKIFSAISDVSKVSIKEGEFASRVKDIARDERFYHLQRIDNAIFFGTVEYFQKAGSQWCNLPLTTLMISSPGEVYSGKVLDYTTDALPVELQWFDNPKKIFLAESSQFLLELRLLQPKLNSVFCIYNSFRKEPSDFSHLSEFQHIEFEGHVTYEENISTAIGLLDFITKKITREIPGSLLYFRTEEEVKELETTFEATRVKRITFKEALEALYANTGDERYKEFTMKHFGSWEEIRLTEIFDSHVQVESFPLAQIPFYHNELRRDENGIPLSESADIILQGYREVIGSGVRIKDPKALQEKARHFNLPEEDYAPYLEMRAEATYLKTAGFGMGWQRYVQWLLKMPYIWDATHTPRTHLLPKP